MNLRRMWFKLQMQIDPNQSVNTVNWGSASEPAAFDVMLMDAAI